MSNKAKQELAGSTWDTNSEESRLFFGDMTARIELDRFRKEKRASL
jgi:hypothetical protein